MSIKIISLWSDYIFRPYSFGYSQKIGHIFPIIPNNTVN